MFNRSRNASFLFRSLLTRESTDAQLAIMEILQLVILGAKENLEAEKKKKQKGKLFKNRLFLLLDF